jgi:hypothetical protein
VKICISPDCLISGLELRFQAAEANNLPHAGVSRFHKDQLFARMGNGEWGPIPRLTR